MRAPYNAGYGKKCCEPADGTVIHTNDSLCNYSFLAFDSINSHAGSNPPLIYMQHCSFLC